MLIYGIGYCLDHVELVGALKLAGELNDDLAVVFGIKIATVLPACLVG